MYHCNPIMPGKHADRCAYLKFVLKKCAKNKKPCEQYKRLLQICENGGDIFNFNDCAIRYRYNVNNDTRSDR